MLNKITSRELFLCIVVVSLSVGDGCTKKGTRFYVSGEGAQSVLSLFPPEEQHPKIFQTWYMYPVHYSVNNPIKGDPLEFCYTLPGDIQGDSYGFHLLMASLGSAILDISIVLSQGQSETVLASTTFTVLTKEELQDQLSQKVGNYCSVAQMYDARVNGIDPQCQKGDILILRLSNVSKELSAAVLFDTNASGEKSIITMPRILGAISDLGTVEGWLVGKNSCKAIGGALVVLCKKIGNQTCTLPQEGRFISITADGGRFTFSNVRPGNYTIAYAIGDLGTKGSFVGGLVYDLKSKSFFDIVEGAVSDNSLGLTFEFRKEELAEFEVVAGETTKIDFTVWGE